MDGEATAACPLRRRVLQQLALSAAWWQVHQVFAVSRVLGGNRIQDSTAASVSVVGRGPAGLGMAGTLEVSVDCGNSTNHFCGYGCASSRLRHRLSFARELVGEQPPSCTARSARCSSSSGFFSLHYHAHALPLLIGVVKLDQVRYIRPFRSSLLLSVHRCRATFPRGTVTGRGCTHFCCCSPSRTFIAPRCLASSRPPRSCHPRLQDVDFQPAGAHDYASTQ
jgi:hypothetical protein